MEHANDLDFTLIQMKQTNCVRMYLGVTYISEIGTICGNYLVNGIINGNIDNLEFETTLTKPKQQLQRPNTRSWTVWKQMLSPLIKGRQLKIPLGQWKNNHSKTGTWNAYCEGHEIYQHTPKQEQKWQ